MELQLPPVGIGELSKRVLVARARLRQRGLAYHVARHELLASPCPVTVIDNKDTTFPRNGIGRSVLATGGVSTGKTEKAAFQPR